MIASFEPLLLRFGCESQMYGYSGDFNLHYVHPHWTS